MRMRIQATVTYHLDEPTDRAYLQARIVPAATARQHVLAYPLEVDPGGWQFTHDDYWGTRTVDIEITDTHSHMSLGLICDVGLTAAGKPLASTFEVLDRETVRQNFSEFLLPRELTPVPEVVDAIVEKRASATGRPTELVAELVDAHASGAGDELTHSALAAVRAAGVPARFVSGYRAPSHDFEPGDSGDGQLSSWFDFWDGAWHGWDPVTNSLMSDRLVVVGWGRDRHDARPLSGIHRSNGDGEASTEVTVTRLS